MSVRALHRVRLAMGWLSMLPSIVPHIPLDIITIELSVLWLHLRRELLRLGLVKDAASKIVDSFIPIVNFRIVHNIDGIIFHAVPIVCLILLRSTFGSFSAI